VGSRILLCDFVFDGAGMFEGSTELPLFSSYSSGIFSRGEGIFALEGLDLGLGLR
jgi:hypothetical protein